MTDYNKSPMSEDFHDWLAMCPTNWYRGKITDYDVHYIFDIDRDVKTQ